MLSGGKSLISHPSSSLKTFRTLQFEVPSVWLEWLVRLSVVVGAITFMVLQYNEVYREMLSVVFQMVSAET